MQERRGRSTGRNLRSSNRQLAVTEASHAANAVLAAAWSGYMQALVDKSAAGDTTTAGGGVIVNVAV